MMEATRSMALASSTEVPPNFMTIIGAASDDCSEPGTNPAQPARDPSLRLKSGCAQDDANGDAPVDSQCTYSSQVSLGFQQFGVEDGCACSSADRVMREHGELPVEH